MTEGKVIVTDIDMPFWQMVVLMIKFGVAAIPALIFLSIVYAVLGAFFGALFGW